MLQKCQKWYRFVSIRCFSNSKIRQNSFTRWGSFDAPPDRLVGWGGPERDTPPHSLPLDAFGISIGCLAPRLVWILHTWPSGQKGGHPCSLYVYTAVQLTHQLTVVHVTWCRQQQQLSPVAAVTSIDLTPVVTLYCSSKSISQNQHWCDHQLAAS